jgi:hypothetical protein
MNLITVMLQQILSYMNHFPVVLFSDVAQHRFDADPGPTFHFDADLNPDPDADPTSSFTHVEKSEFFFTFNNSSASFHCFIFLVSGMHRCHKYQYINIVDSVFKFPGKRIA